MPLLVNSLSTKVPFHASIHGWMDGLGALEHLSGARISKFGIPPTTAEASAKTACFRLHSDVISPHFAKLKNDSKIRKYLLIWRGKDVNPRQT